MRDVNEIGICRDDYESQEEFENAIKKAIMVLLENKYIATIRYDCCGTYKNVAVIEFNYADPTYGGDYPYWLSPDEIETVIFDWEREQEREPEEPILN